MAGSHQIYPQPTPFFTTATPAANKLPVRAEILIAHSIPDSSRSPPAENAMFRLETLHFVCSIQFVLLTPSVLFQFWYGGAFLPTLCSPHSLFAQILPWISVHPFTQWCPIPSPSHPFSSASFIQQRIGTDLSQFYMSHLLLLGKFEYTGGPIFKVVLEC